MTLLLPLALLPILLAACTAGPSTRPPVVQNDSGDRATQQPPPSTPRTVPLPPLDQQRSSSINWRDCDDETRRRLGDRGVPDELRFSCAGVLTSLDAPNLPERGVQRIAVLKVGGGPIPLVVLNDIDGTPGTLYAARMAARMPAEFTERFTLIGVDRRGSGLSGPINCIPADVRRQLLGHDPAADDVATLLDAARKAGQKCSIALEGERGAYDSWRTAGDLEAIRQQLGVDHLNALARGEASNVLVSYADRFPGQVGRFVLDGIPDPSADIATVLEEKAAGASAALEAFGKACAATDCPLQADVRRAVGTLVERLRQAPQITEGGDQMGPALALYAVRQGLRQPDRWPELADAIAAALAGDPAPLARFVEPLLSDGRYHPPRLGVSIATKCNDSTARLPADQINQLTERMRTGHPLFGGLVTQQLAWCSPWPPRQQPLSLPDVTGVPPLLVTSTAADPVTPEPGTARAAAQLPSAVRVAWQGTGHGALSSPCVRDAVSGFVAEGAVPQQGIVCPA